MSPNGVARRLHPGGSMARKARWAVCLLAAVTTACGGAVEADDAARGDDSREAPARPPSPGPPIGGEPGAPPPGADPPPAFGGLEPDHCLPGEPPVTLLQVRSGDGLALGDGALFVVDGGELYDCNGAIYRVPFAGGDPQVIVDGECSPTRIAYDRGELYWISEPGYGNGSLTRYDLASGDRQNMAGVNRARALALDDRYVYVGYESEPNMLQSPGEVRRYRRDQAESEVVGSSPGVPATIALDDEFVYWGSSVAFLNGQENMDSSVHRARKDGSASVVLYDDFAWPRGLVRRGSRLIFAHDGGEVVSLSAAGGNPQTIASGLGSLQDLAIAHDEVFFTAWEEAGAVYRVPLDGTGGVRVLADAGGYSDQIVAGETCVYWTEQYVDDDNNALVRKAGR